MQVLSEKSFKDRCGEGQFSCLYESNEHILGMRARPSGEGNMGL